MDKKYYVIISIVLVFILLGVGGYFLLSKEKITISFNTGYEKTIQNIEISKGESVNLPILERDGYNFTGWYINNELIDNNYKFDKTTILVAKWETDKYVVSFNSNGGSSVKNLELTCGDKIQLPIAPTRSGYTFNGWQNQDGNVVSNGMILSCVNTTLTARWNKKEETVTKTFTVSFNSNGGTNVNSVKVTCGKKLSLPTAPTRNEYVFGGWSDKNGNVVSNGVVLPCEDTTLSAIWEKEEKKLSSLNNNNVSADLVCSSKKIKVGENVECQIVVTYENTSFNYVELNLSGSPASLIKATNSSFAFDYDRDICCPNCKCMSTNVGKFTSSNLVSSNSKKSVTLGTVLLMTRENCISSKSIGGIDLNGSCHYNGTPGVKTHNIKFTIKNTLKNETVIKEITKEYTVVE